MAPSLVTSFLQSHNIEPKDADIPKKLEFHFDAVMYNITSVACMLTLIKGDKKIMPQHMENVKSYILAECAPKKATGKGKTVGGTSMASDFFGYAHPAYAAGNGGADVQAINFEEGVARPALGAQSGGCGVVACHGGAEPIVAASPLARSFIRKVLKHHEMKISAAALETLYKVIDAHIRCLGTDLAPFRHLTLARFTKVLALKRHAIFH